MAAQSLTVAVTGPTGDLGIAIVDKLERARSVKKIVGMARRPFDPAEQGWKKTEYRQGDVQDAGSVRDTVKDADVLIHLAFSLMGEGDRTRAINVDGSRTVFEAAAEAGVQRICYASSVAAYGFHADNPLWLTEEVPARGTAEHFYSAQKAEVESVLGEVLLRHQRTAAYVFRPCVVAGPRAQMLLEEMPYYRISGAVPDAVVGLLSSMPILKPVIPDPGVRFQLVHEDDVAAAFLAGVRGQGEPGAYNLAGPGHHPHVRRGRRAGLVLDPGARAGGGHHRRDRRPAAHGARVGVLDPRGPPARADEGRPRRGTPEVEARAHRQGHAEADGGRPPRGRARGPLTRHKIRPTTDPIAPRRALRVVCDLHES